MPTRETPKENGSVADPAGRHLLLDRNLHVIFSISFVVVLGVSSLTPVFPAVVEALGKPAVWSFTQLSRIKCRSADPCPGNVAALHHEETV